jgi:hypothetical protein
MRGYCEGFRGEVRWAGIRGGVFVKVEFGAGKRKARKKFAIAGRRAMVKQFVGYLFSFKGLVNLQVNSVR